MKLFRRLLIEIIIYLTGFMVLALWVSYLAWENEHLKVRVDIIEKKINEGLK